MTPQEILRHVATLTPAACVREDLLAVAASEDIEWQKIHDLASRVLDTQRTPNTPPQYVAANLCYAVLFGVGTYLSYAAEAAGDDWNKHCAQKALTAARGSLAVYAAKAEFYREAYPQEGPIAFGTN